MKKFKKIILWVLGSIITLALLIFFVVGPIMRKQTKKHSPEKHITFNQNDLEIRTFYSSPSKKGRVIFGELVPYNIVWRTGANEASTFTTNKDLEINGSKLKSGTYTLWTIPHEDSWDIIFNTKMYDWGVDFQNGEASRESDFDALITRVNVLKSATIVENFDISYLETSTNTFVMTFSWDDVTVPVKILIE